MDLDPIREKLIASIHSNEEAKRFFIDGLRSEEILLKLCVICAPYDKYSADPRMEAAYYISQYSAEMLVGVLPILAALLTIPSCDGEDMDGNIACHLIRAIRKAKSLYQGTLYLDLDEVAAEYGCGENG
jgi:hypothetical protein